jgi:hypothetical protein
LRQQALLPLLVSVLLVLRHLLLLAGPSQWLG